MVKRKCPSPSRAASSSQPPKGGPPDEATDEADDVVDILEALAQPVQDAGADDVCGRVKEEDMADGDEDPLVDEELFHELFDEMQEETAGAEAASGTEAGDEAPASATAPAGATDSGFATPPRPKPSTFSASGRKGMGAHEHSVESDSDGDMADAGAASVASERRDEDRPNTNLLKSVRPLYTSLRAFRNQCMYTEMYAPTSKIQPTNQSEVGWCFGVAGYASTIKRLCSLELVGKNVALLVASNSSRGATDCNNIAPITTSMLCLATDRSIRIGGRLSAILMIRRPKVSP